MTDTKKANALFKAAKAGDTARIRELLAAGAPLEATDANRMTPVMLAAQAGQEEAFRTLVGQGANLHALGLCHTDLLECASEGGNVEIVRFLLDQGHPVNGHWQPRSKVDERLGHLTPLLMAAINGHVDAVRVLLGAGANQEAKFDRQTALQIITEDIKHPNDEDEVKQVPRLRQIAALLAGPAADAADDGVALEIGKFAANARRPAYQRFRKKLAQQCGAAQPWQPAPDHGVAATDVVRFTLVGCDQPEEVEALQQQARKSGCQLVLTDAWGPGDDANLVLFPTDDKLAVVAAVGTEGANYSVQTAQVIAWLKKLDEDNPFTLTFCGHDLIGGAFLGAVKGVKKLAASMAEFCPPCLDEDCETPEDLAVALKKRKSFLLRWD